MDIVTDAFYNKNDPTSTLMGQRRMNALSLRGLAMAKLDAIRSSRLVTDDAVVSLTSDAGHDAASR
jgi:hypothetical protein